MVRMSFFRAVGTPPDEDGSADLRYVLDVACSFGRCIKRYTLLVTKSTVPVGTAEKSAKLSAGNWTTEAWKLLLAWPQSGIPEGRDCH